MQLKRQRQRRIYIFGWLFARRTNYYNSPSAVCGSGGGFASCAQETSSTRAAERTNLFITTSFWLSFAESPIPLPLLRLVSPLSALVEKITVSSSSAGPPLLLIGTSFSSRSGTLLCASACRFRFLISAQPEAPLLLLLLLAASCDDYRDLLVAAGVLARLINMHSPLEFSAWRQVCPSRADAVLARRQRRKTRLEVVARRRPYARRPSAQSRRARARSASAA